MTSSLFGKWLEPLSHILLLIVVVSLVFPHSAHAYLDPGTGSYALQILAAAFFGALFTLKMYWRRLKAFFSERFGRKGQDEE